MGGGKYQDDTLRLVVSGVVEHEGVGYAHLGLGQYSHGGSACLPEDQLNRQDGDWLTDTSIWGDDRGHVSCELTALPPRRAPLYDLCARCPQAREGW